MRARVWAPGAGRVELVTGGGPLGLEMSAGGWWETSRPDVAAPGTDYAFSVDGGPARPDPRSAQQPYGVHGQSRFVDHSATSWGDGSWRGLHLPSAVVYECHIGTFSAEGTFDGAIGHLDHLKRLGVDALELMPVAEFSGERGWGYDGVHLYAPHHSYGGPEGLKRLVDACHRANIGVILDVVYNHLGPSGNYLGCFGPYFTDRYSTPWGAAFNLDGPESLEVRRYILDNALGWFRDYHMDGLRLDATHAIIDSSATHLLEQMAAEVELTSSQLGRPLWLVAESDANDWRLTAPREAGGYGLAASWDEDFHHSLHSLLTGERSGYYADFGSVSDMAAVLADGYAYAGRWSQFRRRVHGRAGPGAGASRLVVFAQNHDQIGNRAAGERLCQLVSLELLKVAAAMVLTSPFVPLIFQGEEWAASTPFMYFTSHPEHDLARAVTEGRRREFEAFGWAPSDIADPQDGETFDRSRLVWSELAGPDHAAMLDWHRFLIGCRRDVAGLAGGALSDFSARYDEEARYVVVEGRGLVRAAGFGSATVEVPVGSAPAGLGTAAPGHWRVEVAAGDVTLDGDRLVLDGAAFALLSRCGEPAGAAGVGAGGGDVAPGRGAASCERCQTGPRGEWRSGSAPALGAGGRGFESPLPDRRRGASGRHQP